LLNGFSEKGVEGFFATHGGGGSVAGIDGGFFGEGQNLFANTGKQLVAIASGQVPTTHTVGKENIPAEKLILFGKVKAEAAGAVTGNEQELGSRPWVRNWA